MFLVQSTKSPASLYTTTELGWVHIKLLAFHRRKAAVLQSSGGGEEGGDNRPFMWTLAYVTHRLIWNPFNGCVFLKDPVE